jgi:dolichol-phosphate mannosyltransferase
MAGFTERHQRRDDDTSKNVITDITPDEDHDFDGTPDLITTFNRDADTPEIELTVIIPTRNESGNVPVLLDRLAPALAGLRAEIILVDDSDDRTPATVARHSRGYPIPVRMLHRRPESRKGGLSSAVVSGAGWARGTWVLVMDADLQHPPESAGLLARTVMRHDADIVIGTRYAGAGSVHGLNSFGRLLASMSTTRLAKAVFPRRLATVSDPMSGLFAFRKDAVDLGRLNPVGFKILLELLIRHPSARVAEVAYEMAPRQAGESNAGLRQGWMFVRHVLRLGRHRMAGQLGQWPSNPAGWQGMVRRMFAVGMVGLTGIAVNTVVLWFCFSRLHMHHLVGAALATQASTAWNFAFTDLVVYRRDRGDSVLGRGVRYFMMNNLLLVLRLPLLQVLVAAGFGLLTGNVISLVALYLVRFVIVDRLIYGAAREKGRDPVVLLVDPVATAAASTPSRKRYQHLTYRYDVAGVVRIGSQIQLPELEFFRAGWVGDDEVDIAIRVGDVGPRGPRRRATMTEYARPTTPTTLRYEEHLGRLGANFRIELGERINIEVGPLLARSPHVVYTNIVEALLRFVMVSRGRMLLHSACVVIDGVGVMLSALTDTGKTATVLRLLRDHGGVFLSDDMTIVDANGTATCFPKPLTISAHTLRAVQATDLTPAEWRRLQLQSRLHSKGGRSLALMLSRFNLPIMGVNAITQLLIPPPKYDVDRLVPCRVGSSTTVQELFIIERGAPRLSELDHEATLERMLDNTDDAYEFPPFRHLAPALTIGGHGYQELREREREILDGFLSGIRTRVLASDTFGWADEIPRLIDGGTGSGGLIRSGHGTAWPRWGGRRAAAGGAA